MTDIIKSRCCGTCQYWREPEKGGLQWMSVCLHPKNKQKDPYLTRPITSIVRVCINFEKKETNHG